MVKSAQQAPSNRMDILLGESYVVLPFSQLELPYQMAVGHYMAIEGEAWSDALPEGVCWRTPEQQRRGLMRHLSKLVEMYGGDMFGVAVLSSECVRKAIMLDTELAQDFTNWEAYHAWYSGASDLPRHPKTNRWPVILSDSADETLQDGWHRVHSYLSRGDDTIPAVFYPREHHLHRARAIA